MSAAHTPGPWRVTKRSAAPNGLDIMCGSIRIAAVSAANANAAQSAALIAAAPQLAEALRECEAVLSAQMLDGCTFEELNAARDKVRAALTAARVTP